MRHPSAPWSLLWLLPVVLTGCPDPSLRPCGMAVEIKGDVATDYILRQDLEKGEVCDWPLVVANAALADIGLPEDTAIQVTVDGQPLLEERWDPVREYAVGGHLIRVTALEDTRASVTFHVRGPLPERIDADQALSLTAPTIIGDPQIVGMGLILRRLAGDGHGGRMMEKWLTDFSTGPDARTGPGDLLAYIRATYGTDATTWDLDQLPFRVVSVQNRLDTMNGVHCGDLRVVIDVDHDVYRPFNFSFQFKRLPGTNDVSPSGVVHCTGAALQLARLSQYDLGGSVEAADAYFAAVSTLLNTAITRDNFTLVQSSEAIGAAGQWQFREWARVDNPDAATSVQMPFVFQGKKMGQAVDVPRLNAAGADHDAFMRFIEANASGLDGLTVLIPDTFLATSSIATEGSYTGLDLSGLDAGVSAAYPDLRKHIELVGCVACHSTEQAFTHSRWGGNESPFLQRELGARSAFVKSLLRGVRPVPHYGPLQANPILPP